MPEPLTTGTMLHGPGGLLATPGLGVRRRKGKRWGMRTKDTQITGRLYRSETGRFSAGNGPSSAAPKAPKPPKRVRGRKRAAKPKQTDEERAQASAAKRATNAADVAKRMAESDTGLSPSGSAALLAFASGTQPTPEQGAGLAQMGLAEQATDGSYRMTPTGRGAVSAMQAGDYQRAVDSVSRGTDASGKRAQRLTERTARQQATQARREQTQARRAETAARRAAKQPAKGSGGKTPAQAAPARTPSPSPPSKRPRRRGSAAPSSGGGGSSGGGAAKPKPKPVAKPAKAPAKQIGPALTEAVQQLSEGADVTPAQIQQLVTNGLVKLNKDGDPILTAAGLRATMKEAPVHTGVMIALYPDPAAAKQIAAQKGVTEPIDQMHLTLAFLGDSSETPLSSNKDKLIAMVKQWAAEKGQSLKGTINGLGRFFHAEDDQTNAVFVSPDVPGLPELRQSLCDWIEQSGFDYAQNHGFTPHITVAYVPLDAPTPPIRVESPVTFDHVTLAWGDEQYDYPLGSAPATKAFVVYKDHTGRDRWIARTTTAYRDRDGEIISEAALDQDSQRMTATKQFGPLRWWHVGDPDPSNTAAPWGIGLDIGDCDYSTVIGRTRVESGTFRDSGIARKVAQAADQLEMSPGFFHPLDQPDAAGVFGHIRTFERSVVPVRYGRASNLFTGFTVKEFRMEVPEMERRFKAMYTELGLTPEQGAQLGQQLVQTEKAAQQQGIAFKDADHPDVVINGVTYKAFPPKADAPGEPDPTTTTTELKAPPMESIVEDVEVDPMAEAPEGDYIGDMGRADFLALMTEAFAPLVKALDISGKMGSQIEELKTMMGGVATKEQGVVSEVAALKARLAEIEGNQPATVLPAELEEAFKSAGPVQTQEPERKQIESTPERPWAGWAAKTFPELYQNGENA